ncbi:methyltransferase [Nocardia bhagyanarayanae]|uniref:Hydroxyneurosporene-O-methyltransferase n=1 Tax=Nocardia bhagyanarayanae TaxID=1215925 RepID=A0A543FG78_9NOCA|nr:methyltransferase [Nocardia bhagyanarayanae]TQM32873.1 hydroxyneurosporene-O-methyltransferase [Nocardia bhagyanarayanae]
MTTTLAKVPPARIVRLVEGARSRLQSIDHKLIPAPVSMLEMITASWLTQAVYTAAKLGIADELSAGPLDAEELAERVGANPDALRRLLRLLSSRSLFRHRKDGRYELTSLGDTLRTDAPISMRAFALLVGCPEHWEHWSMLARSVETGEESVTRLRGMGVFDYMETNRELAEIFNDAMTTVSDMSIPPILAVYDFSAFRTIADVGGGHGRLLAAILKQAPRSTGILFDLPSVTAGAPPLLREHGVADRVTIESGSFFDAVPAGADAYVLKHVVETWDDARALHILRNVRRRIAQDGRLLLIEAVLPQDDSPHFGKLLDMEMLVSVGGRERTAAEYGELLTRAGFRPRRVLPTASPVSVIEAEPDPGHGR